MKRIIISSHAKKQMIERGVSEKEVIETIRKGERLPAKHNRTAYRHNFQYNNKWGNKFFHIKQVMPTVKEEASVIVITVFTFYF